MIKLCATLREAYREDAGSRSWFGCEFAAARAGGSRLGFGTPAPEAAGFGAYPAGRSIPLTGGRWGGEDDDGCGERDGETDGSPGLSGIDGEGGEGGVGVGG